MKRTSNKQPNLTPKEPRKRGKWPQNLQSEQKERNHKDQSRKKGK